MDTNTLNNMIDETMRILGTCFSCDPKEAESRRLLDGMTVFSFKDDWPFGEVDELRDIEGLLQSGLQEGVAELSREYQRLFIGPSHFVAPAWGSVYLDREQVLFGCSTLELRQWMRKNGIEWLEDKREPEDHIGRMLLLLSWLALENPLLIGEYLSEHLMTWVPRYLELLEGDAQNPFYLGLAKLTRISLNQIMCELGVTAASRRIYF